MTMGAETFDTECYDLETVSTVANHQESETLHHLHLHLAPLHRLRCLPAFW